MEPDDDHDEGSSGPLLPPDDRLWRHPSELALIGGARTATPAPRMSESGGGEMRMWSVALLSGVVGAVLATAAVYTLGGFTHHITVPALERDVDASPVVTLASTGTPSGFVLGAERVQASCVVLVVRGKHGSEVSNGVIFRSDGMMLTTAHTVIGAQSMSATVGGNRRVTARLVALDPATDLAVLKLAGGGYTPAPLGTAIDLKVGDPVITVRPPGSGDGSVPGDQASIGALGQAIVGSSGAHLTDLVRIDTSVTSTAVGGPVLDGDGTVVAISTASSQDGATVEWATPVDLAREIATQLLTSGRVVPVWLGVAGGDLGSAEAHQLGVGGGAHVTEVYNDSPASSSGLRVGDVVIGLDGHQVTSMANLIMAVHALPPGTAIDLDVERGATSQQLQAVLTPRPASIG